HIDGLLLTAAQPSDANQALLATALAGKPWRAARLAVFAQTPVAPSDPIVCTCMNVAASAILAAIDDGADVAQLKQRLGCGTVCGSCVPQLTRLCREPRLA
ncbi:(2Fe-2S)-binding protein, partial [Xanthomonas cannabis]